MAESGLEYSNGPGKQVANTLLRAGILAVYGLPAHAAGLATEKIYGVDRYYIDIRYGQGEDLFGQYKLQTMYPEDESSQPEGKNDDEDDRIFTLGRYVRKVYLDEVAQVERNVPGDMNIIGTRSVNLRQRELLEKDDPVLFAEFWSEYTKRRPGVFSRSMRTVHALQRQKRYKEANIAWMRGALEEYPNESFANDMKTAAQLIPEVMVYPRQALARLGRKLVGTEADMQALSDSDITNLVMDPLRFM